MVGGVFKLAARGRTVSTCEPLMGACRVSMAKESPVWVMILAEFSGSVVPAGLLQRWSAVICLRITQITRRRR